MMLRRRFSAILCAVAPAIVSAARAADPLLDAVRKGDADKVRDLLAANPSPAQLQAAIALARKEKKTAIFKLLMNSGTAAKALVVSPAVLASYTGDYYGGRGMSELRLTVTTENGRLIVTANTVHYILAPTSSTRFRGVDDPQLTVKFISEDGKPSRLVMTQASGIMEFRRMLSE